MNLFKWAEQQPKKFKWYDFSVLKLSMLVFGLWLALICPCLSSVNPWLYFSLGLVGSIYLFWKMLK